MDIGDRKTRRVNRDRGKEREEYRPIDRRRESKTSFFDDANERKEASHV